MLRRPTLASAACLLVAVLLVACAPLGPAPTASTAATGSTGSADSTGSAGPSASAVPDGAEPLLAAIADRLGASAEVAAFKQAAGLPIDDPAREEAVIAAAGESARAAGIDADRAEEVVLAQIAASKTAQAGFQRLWTEGRSEPPAAPSLDHARAVITASTTALVDALAAPLGCPLDDAAVASVGAPLTASGLDAATVDAVVAEAVEPLCP